MHRIRGADTQHHEVQTGLVTSTLGGAWATSNGSKLKAAKLADRCSQALPHHSFAEKIRDRDISRDLRLENVYYIDIDALDVQKRTGMASFLVYIILYDLTDSTEPLIRRY